MRSLHWRNHGFMFATNRRALGYAGPVTAALLATLLAVSLAGASSTTLFAAQPASPATQPSTPEWPPGDLPDRVQALLLDLFKVGPNPPDNLPYYLRAPEWEIDKPLALKDPDLLWEYHGGPGTACHSAVSTDHFLACTGKRLARTFGVPYYGGLTLFDVSKGYYYNEAVAQMAGFYALYHAFVGDFDAPQQGGYIPSSAADIRNHQIYHRRVAAAYERHQRDIIARMFRDTVDLGAFQADLTRSAGVLAIGYARTLQVIERKNDWLASNHRSDALALLSALVQRCWWEWMVPQPDGPVTAGFADLGSEATYSAAVLSDPTWVGSHQFIYEGAPVRSLRKAALDTGGWDGLWFDADYALPGDWWCHARFTSGSAGHIACLEHSQRQARDGTKSPFGQYYGTDGSCQVRAAGVTPYSCGPTNLGSIAEEWLWTHIGARAGAAILRDLAASSDPDLPLGAIGARVFDEITTRLGYGVSGWHGADPYNDDMEFKRDSLPDQPVRTLSAGRHDDKPQNGLYSLGERATLGDLTAINGDTWPEDKQDYSGGMENHLPGPNALYGTVVLGFVLGDKVSDGLSGSLYDNFHRNNVDEFNSWLMLVLSSYYRCPEIGVDGDPVDPRCMAFEVGMWPDPPSIARVPLFVEPSDASVPAAFRYLWREPVPGPNPAIDPAYIAGGSNQCREGMGVPWRAIYDLDSDADAPYLLDEGGFGAYDDLLQGWGAFMRLLAARHPLVPLVPDQAEHDAYDEMRTDVIEPWYDYAYAQVSGILDMLSTDWKYVPQIENSTCIGTNPQPGNSDEVVLAWQYGTADSVASATVRRAMWYSLTPLWYWYYSDWIDIGDGDW